MPAEPSPCAKRLEAHSAAAVVKKVLKVFFVCIITWFFYFLFHYLIVLFLTSYSLRLILIAVKNFPYPLGFGFVLKNQLLEHIRF